MPQRPPSNSASKNHSLPGQTRDSTTMLPAEERQTSAPDLLLDSGLTLEKYKLPILLGVTLLVLGFVGWSYYQSHQAGVAAAAGALLDTAKTEADYQKIISVYPATDAAANASLLLGRAKYNANDFAGAAQTWRDFAAKFPQHPLVPDALVGIAGALEAQGKLDEARAMYQRVATSYQSSYVAPLARLSEATLLLGQGKTDDAKHVYEDIMASAPKSDVGQMAEQGLKSLNTLPLPGATPLPSASPAPVAASAPFQIPAAPPAATATAVPSPPAAAVVPPATAAVSPLPAANPAVIPTAAPSASDPGPAAPAATPRDTP